MPSFLRISSRSASEIAEKFLPANPDFAGGRSFQADQSAQQRALAGARAAENHQSLAALHVES